MCIRLDGGASGVFYSHFLGSWAVDMPKYLGSWAEGEEKFLVELDF